MIVTFTVTLLSFYIFFTRDTVLGRVIAFFAITCASEFTKRFIYFPGLEEPSELSYYAVLFIPDLILIIFFFAKCPTLPTNLARVLFVALALSIYSISIGQNLFSVFVTLRTVLLPLTLLFGIQSYSAMRINRQDIRLLFALMTLATTYSLIQVVAGYPEWEVRWDTYSPAQMNLWAITSFGTVQRAFSFFSEVAAQGMSFGVAFYFLCSAYRGKSAMKVALFVITASGIVLSGSKAAIIAFLLSLFARRVRFNYLVYITILLLLILTVANMRPLLNSIIELMGSSLSSRLFTYLNPATFYSRIDLLSNFSAPEHTYIWLLGSGIGYEAGIVMDNLFVYVFHKSGVLGLCLLAGMISAVFKPAFQSDHRCYPQHLQATYRQALVFFTLFSFTSLAFTTRAGIGLLLTLYIYQKCYFIMHHYEYPKANTPDKRRYFLAPR